MPTARELQREYEEVLVPRMMRHRRRAVFGGGDSTAPVLTLPLGLPLGDTSGYLGVTTNDSVGTLYYVVTTSATPPSKAQVKAGQNDGGTSAVYAGNQAISSTGAKSATATGLSSATVYYAYFMHEDAAGNQSNVSAASSFTTLTTGTSDTSFDNLIAAFTGAPADLRKGYIARCIGALYAAGVWSKTNLLYIQAAHDQQAGTLNWIAPGSFALTLVNSPVFVADRGFTPDGTTGYLDTGWDPSNNGGGIYQRDSAHVGLYQRTNVTVGSDASGIGTSNGLWVCISAPSSASNARARVNTNTIGVLPAESGTLPLHRMGVRRASSTTIIPVLDGVDGGSLSMNSAALDTGDLNFGRNNTTTFSNQQFAAGHVGNSLDATECAAYYAALHDYMVAVGADT